MRKRAVLMAGFVLALLPQIALTQDHGPPRFDGEQIADDRPPRMPPPGGGGEPRPFQQRMENAREFLKDLNLSDAQKQALKDFRKNRETLKIDMEDLIEERETLNTLLKDSKTKEPEILQAVEKLNRSMTELNTKRVKNMLSLRKVLTPEQLNQIMDHVQDRKQERRENFQQFRQQQGGGPMQRPLRERFQGGGQRERPPQSEEQSIVGDEDLF